MTTTAPPCETGALPRRWDAWYSARAAPSPERVDAESRLMGLGARSAKGGTSALQPGEHLPTRVDPTFLDAVCTRGFKSFGRCVYSPDRSASEFAPPLPTPVFVSGLFTRPRNMPDPGNPYQKAWKCPRDCR